ncbi:MAG: hypothetical protein HQK54_03695 [Oligoflexales bacterium]|nr:hypothetical protein [Oligoflexales bacterium]
MFSSCTTIDAKKITKVKKVAIVGFEGRIPEQGGAVNEYIQAISDQAFGPKLYQVAQNQLKGAMSWQFAGREKFMNSAAYKEASSEKMNKMATAISYKDKYIQIPGVLNHLMGSTLVSDKKRGPAVARQLGVDSLMVIKFDIAPETMTTSMSDKLMGMAKDNPVKVRILECNLSIKLVNAQTGDIIWDQPGIQGKSGETPSVSIYGIPFSNLKQRAVVSSFSNALTAHIREVKGKVEKQ